MPEVSSFSRDRGHVEIPAKRYYHSYGIASRPRDSQPLTLGHHPALIPTVNLSPSNGRSAIHMANRVANPQSPAPSPRKSIERISVMSRSLPPNDVSVLWPVKTVATALQISTRQVWKLVSAHRLPSPMRMGRSVRWRAADIDRFVECDGDMARFAASRKDGR